MFMKLTFISEGEGDKARKPVTTDQDFININVKLRGNKNVYSWQSVEISSRNKTEPSDISCLLLLWQPKKQVLSTKT